ncbi:MAG: hypothetical protein WD022_05855 [Balneolaceae bacterium]
MKNSIPATRFYLLLLPFLFTGCYTQFQTYDKFPLEEDRYAGYYAWDGFEEGRSAQNQDAQNSEEYYNEDEEYIDEELALEMNDIYYQDYETKRWYQEHYANKLFWEGYAEGYNDGYYDGWTGHYPYSARYSINRHRYLYGYTGAYNYYGFYHYPGIWSSAWIGFGVYPYASFYHGYYGYNGYYYDSYWGHPYYSFYSYGYAYNNYYRSKKYSRSADLYRKGPRNSGLVNNTDVRTRSGLKTNNTNSSVRTRGTDLTRSRSVNTNTSRVRSTGTGTVGRTSTGRSTNPVTRTRGSSVERKSSGNDNSSTRSRGSGSDINRSSEFSVRSVGTSTNRTYTIPARKVSDIKQRKSTRAFSIGDIFKTTTNQRAINSRSSSGSYNRIGNTISRSSNSGISRSNSSSGSRSTTVKRSSSSSSNRSSGSKSSSSSSSKRSRGN